MSQPLHISSTSVKEQAYQSAWNFYNKGKINQLEMAQCKTAGFVTNRQRHTSSVGDLLQHLNCRSLDDMRICNCSTCHDGFFFFF